MALRIDGLEVETITDIEAQRNGKVAVTLIGANITEAIDADEIVAEYGADVLLDAIGGFEDWFDKGGIKADEVAEWLEYQGYFVERN
ncbi:hypothetical protein Q5T56_004195 [Salmonella enterica]|nr:hypothetical protein [Salmonella enterica]HCI4072951.1 hypothetical protein [Salmonella enterica subsp. enterica serovar Infantis]HCI4149816.1 hypothetical protein [Salmonella enterica subsp. enterica serovar Infantis]